MKNQLLYFESYSSIDKIILSIKINLEKVFASKKVSSHNKEFNYEHLEIFRKIYLGTLEEDEYYEDSEEDKDDDFDDDDGFGDFEEDFDEIEEDIENDDELDDYISSGDEKNIDEETSNNDDRDTDHDIDEELFND